ncbi:hypothetical protein ETC03_05715 [Geobacillus sp. MMMUD3]|nr:hypothetical protein [Geobacillus sp. MMMUD3]
MREKLLHFPCVSRIHSTSERKNPPDFRREGAKCELAHCFRSMVIVSTALLCHFSTRKTLLHRSCFSLIVPWI